MKYTTLPLVVSSLTQKQHEITLPEETIKKARKALDKMLEYS
jgi:quinolinate synthase